MRAKLDFLFSGLAAVVLSLLVPACGLIDCGVDEALLGSWEVVLCLYDDETVVENTRFQFFDEECGAGCVEGLPPVMFWLFEGGPSPQVEYSFEDGMVMLMGTLIIEGDIAYGTIEGKLTLSDDGTELNGDVEFTLDGFEGCEGEPCEATVKATRAED